VVVGVRDDQFAVVRVDNATIHGVKPCSGGVAVRVAGGGSPSDETDRPNINGSRPSHVVEQRGDEHWQEPTELAWVGARLHTSASGIGGSK
jgi:hypothetical protein